ncbi:DUF1850 domain-containing protein [Niallia sp. XMNu-256]|uniref:DUF1850 domain-containing protein n=1 Tax=Niallia sp. XMNu-256 TaxID=3082444 RepID=UPI0030D2289F
MIIKKRKLLIVLFSVLFVISIFILIPYQRCLVFQFQNSGQVIAYMPISSSESFRIKYTHSIHLSDVVESYKLTKDGEIKLYEMEYEDFSIGMPSHASDGERFEQIDGKYYLKNMNQVFPSFDLRVGKVRADHTLIFKGKEYPLSHSIEPGTWTRIKIEKINLWQQWKGVNIIE